MKNLLLLIIVASLVSLSACSKEESSDRFDLITAHIWRTDSLLAGGVDARGTGKLLEKFAGDIKFNEDGTGYFGQYTGTWRFVYDETSIVLESPELPVSVGTCTDKGTDSNFPEGDIELSEHCQSVRSP